MVNAGINKAASCGTSSNTKKLYDDDTENLTQEYSHGLEKNLEALEMEVENLNAMIIELLKRVSKENDRGLQTQPEVKEWVSSAEKVASEASTLLDESISERHKLSKCGDFSQISPSTHRYNGNVLMTLKEVEALRSKGVFKVLVERAPLSHGKKMPPLQNIVSREMLLEKVWKCLAENECRTLGLYGVAGVGKTVLLTRIQNKFEEAGDVSGPLILHVAVASDEVESIQEEIGKRLGLRVRGRSSIWSILERRRFVLLLDGIQRGVDLEEIGIPYPSRKNGSKIVFTASSPEACGMQWVDDVVEITCLSPEEAWDLFQKTVGETTLRSHPDIPHLARIVARRCGGLPIALNLIGKTMSRKRTAREWHHDIHVLVSSTAEFSGREIPILKFAFDNLPGENIKACFLYCALFPRNIDISKQDLVDCWIGEGMIKDEDREIAEIKGYEMICDLVITGFLIENESGYGVKMHDMFLEMALWVTKHVVKSHIYGKRVFEILEEVEKLKSGGVFEVVAGRPTVAVVEERPLQPMIVGQKTILQKAWNLLMDKETKKMGLYGMGGVGKTTLLEQINNKFKVANFYGFEKVIWVVVSKDKRIEKIQDEIGENLGFTTGGDSWKQKEKRQKATEIHTRLKNKKFVLLLDDICEEVDLKEIGVPIPTRENGCKVVFTTRSRQVCGQMGVDDPMEVNCLRSDQAWDLFRDKVGRNTLESHPDILERARQVAIKCRGLPLALIIIGKNMASKRTIQEWDEAIDTLASCAAKFPGMEDHIFPILLYSYDSLREDEPVKSCLQYCALFPEDSLIKKDELADYWIGEGFIDEKQGLKKAKNKAHGIIGSLVQASLLVEEGRDRSYVKMHDVVREMALWIATDFGKDEERCIVQAGVSLREVPTVEKWTSVRRMSLMENEIMKISDSPECPELTTLIFQNNDIRIISGEFFKSMPRLVVLDLSRSIDFNGLPEEISELVSLRYLDLSRTAIRRLPGGLLKLKLLIYLNLEWTLLESISGISNLSSLRTLRLAHSNMWKDLNVMKELQLFEHLEVVTIGIRSILVADQLFSTPSATRVANAIQEIYFKFLKEKDVLTLPNMEVLSTLDIFATKMVEINIERRTPTRNKSPTTSGFPNLSTVTLSFCDGLKDLAWLLYAPNLIFLEVEASSQIEDIISKQKADNIFTEDEAGTIIPFQRLERLVVVDLPVLKSIYWRVLSFPRLRKFSIKKCPNLRKLPLDSKSGCSNPGEDLVIRNGEQHWIDKVEWENEATKERFLSSLQPFE